MLEINDENSQNSSPLNYFFNKIFRAKARLEIPNFDLALSTLSSTLSIECRAGQI